MKIIYILVYNEFTTTSSIKQFLGKGIPFNDLQCYANFVVTRYNWKDDITTDVCKSKSNDFYVVGTIHPKISGKFSFPGRWGVNSKIIEYMLTHKKELCKFLQQQPSIQTPAKCDHYSHNPIGTLKKVQEPESKRKHDELLDLIPKEIQRKYPNYLALIYNESEQKKLAIFKSYQDLDSSWYKKYGGDFLVIPDPDFEKSAILLDDLPFQDLKSES